MPDSDSLAPLVPDGGPSAQAEAKSTMIWSSTMSAGTKASVGAIKLTDTKIEAPISFTIETYSNGTAIVYLEGATPEGQLLFRGTIPKQVVWKKVK